MLDGKDERNSGIDSFSYLVIQRTRNGLMSMINTSLCNRAVEIAQNLKCMSFKGFFLSLANNKTMF